MNKHTFQHGKFYRVTKYGKLNPNFYGGKGNGREAVIGYGDGEPVWFVGLAWKKTDVLPNVKTQTPFYLIASNYIDFLDDEIDGKIRKHPVVVLVHNEAFLYKRDKVKCIEPFPMKHFPTLIGTKTTTLFERLLRNEISTKHFPQGKIE